VKLGEVIRSPRGAYEISTEPSNSDGGRCVWAFAVRDGTEYFVKQFLEPKYPTAESMGSEKSKAVRRKVCAEFEARHLDIMRRLAPGAPGGGNLVTAVDFFRQDTTYYKVTQKISVESVESLEPLTPRERGIVLRTLGHSLQMLHRQGIVHGDLKPTNVLIQRKESSGLYLAKLIDFDDSYLSGEPPPHDQIVGDSVYAAPEWFRYTRQDEGVPPGHLTTKIDIFALGLLVHVQLTGALPVYDGGRFPAPAEAVGAGAPLGLDARLRPELRALLTRMTAADPDDRPTIREVLAALDDQSILAFGSGDAADTAPAGPAGSRIRMNFGDGTPRPAPDGPPSGTGTDVRTPKPGASRVRINGLRRD
jgi:serine/threonine protein kinase